MGGQRSIRKQMDDFKEMVEACELMDLDFKGPPFTWCNNCEGEERISKRLDRFLTNNL